MESKVAQVPSWPDEAQALKKRTWVRYVYVLGDTLLVLLPLYFICEYNIVQFPTEPAGELTSVVLGVAVITLNGKPTRDNAFGKKVETAIQLVSEPAKHLITQCSNVTPRALQYSQSCLQQSVVEV